MSICVRFSSFRCVWNCSARCSRCTVAFFDDLAAQAAAEKGLCRANPSSGGNGSTAWPTASDRDGCGHFQFDGQSGVQRAA